MKQTDNIQKYRIKWLGIEITRKCNYKCVHCARGDAQNLAITPEIIDTMFSQLYQLDNIVILGGETLLELDMLQYLLESVDKYDLRTKKLSLVTNGSVQDSYFIDILSAFADKNKDREVIVSVSNDRYHDKLQVDSTYNFYQSLNSNEQIHIEKTLDSTSSVDIDLVYMGRAKKYIDENIHGYIDKNTHEVNLVAYPENSFRNHQICIKGNTVEYDIALYATGSIGLQIKTDYATQDQFAFGNIMSESLESIFISHNATCPFLCDECYNELVGRNIISFGNPSEPESPLQKELNKYRFSVINKKMELVWMIRKLAHEKFPHIPMHDIIREIPVPGNEEWDFYLINLLHNDIGVRASANVFLHYYQRRFPEASEEMIMNLSIFKYIFRLLSNINIEKYPIMPFGEGITWTELSKRLLCIEQDYITGAKTTPDKLNVCGLIPDTLWENENI